MITALLMKATKSGLRIEFSYDETLKATVVEVSSKSGSTVRSGQIMLPPDYACSDDVVECELEVFLLRQDLMTYEEIHDE